MAPKFEWQYSIHPLRRPYDMGVRFRMYKYCYSNIAAIYVWKTYSNIVQRFLPREEYLSVVSVLFAMKLNIAWKNRGIIDELGTKDI